MGEFDYDVRYYGEVLGLHDGHVVGPIVPSRGLRQGDPLSPYLFIICAEGLSCLLNAKERAGYLHGCRVATGSPYVNHLLFADDCCLYLKATPEEATTVKDCLQIYEDASGQAVNFNKSSIIFSLNVAAVIRDQISLILGVMMCNDHGKYLGAPSLIGKEKKAAFNYILEKVAKLFSSWKSKWLTPAGKEVLLKSVIHSIPSYIMSVFLLPMGTIDDIEKLKYKFWWGDSAQNGIRWKSWSKLCF